VKKLIQYSVLLLVGLSTQVHGQVVDTSRNINTWTLMHNYSRFEDIEMDTSLYDLHLDYNPLYRNGFSYEYLGILGSAAQNHDVFARPGTSNFLFGSSLYPYLQIPTVPFFTIPNPPSQK